MLSLQLRQLPSQVLFNLIPKRRNYNHEQNTPNHNFVSQQSASRVLFLETVIPRAPAPQLTLEPRASEIRS